VLADSQDFREIKWAHVHCRHQIHLFVPEKTMTFTLNHCGVLVGAVHADAAAAQAAERHATGGATWRD